MMIDESALGRAVIKGFGAMEKGMGFGLKTKAKRTARALGWKCRSVGQHLRPVLGAPGARIGAAFHFPTDMCDTDRVYLYALVRGLRPERALEIGTRWGGSARIITAAMEDNGMGRLVGLDPAVEAFRASKRSVHGRFTLVKGWSPGDIPTAAGLHDGLIDFAFVDALHTHHSCKADLEGLLPHLAPGAHVLLHDALHPGISAAADEFVAMHEGVVDLGTVTRDPAAKAPVCNQGFRLLRVGENDEGVMRAAYAQAGVEFPEDPERLYNCDTFAVRIGLVEEVDGDFRWKSDS